MQHTERTFLPAAGQDWALPFYDPFVWLLGGDRTRKVLLDQASVESAQRVLDIGCGTGTFSLLIKELHPGLEVAGLDPDPKALSRSIKKAAGAGLDIQFDRGFSDELPYPDSSFDRVFSTFMFHHLQADEKQRTLREIHRVLTPAGSLHLCDFTPPEAHKGGWLARRIHSNEHLKENTDQLIMKLLTEAGFASAEKLADGKGFMGFLHISYYRAGK